MSSALLGETLTGGNADGKHDDALDVLRQDMRAICSKIPSAEPASATCTAFLQT